MKAIMDEDKVIKLLDSQIRNSYGNVFWTHKIHEKDADIYRCWNNWIKIAQIVLSAISTTGIIFILFGVSQNTPLLATSILSPVNSIGRRNIWSNMKEVKSSNLLSAVLHRF